MAWAYGKGLKLHAVERAILFHHRFVAIHPFDDGNGRMARLLMNLLLMQAGYPPAVIRQQDRGEYYAALAQADDKHTLPLLDFVGGTIVHSMEIYLEASRNESIEEPDDIEKEISLLERDLEGRTQRIDARLDAESRAHFEEHVFRPLWASVKRSVSKFSRMFLSSRQGKVKYEKRADLMEYAKYIDMEFEARLADLILPVVDRATVFVQLLDFRDLSNPFSIEVRLVIEFGELQVAMTLSVESVDDTSTFSESSDPVCQLKIRYQYVLSEFEHRDLLQGLERSILHLIKQQDHGGHQGHSL